MELNWYRSTWEPVQETFYGSHWETLYPIPENFQLFWLRVIQGPSTELCTWLIVSLLDLNFVHDLLSPFYILCTEYIIWGVCFVVVSNYNCIRVCKVWYNVVKNEELLFCSFTLLDIMKCGNLLSPSFSLRKCTS